MKNHVAALALIFALGSHEAQAANEGDEYETTRPPEMNDIQVDTYFMDKNISSGRLTFGAATTAGDIGVVFDRTTDAVYVSANGMSSSYSINAVANAYYSDSPAEASLLASELRSYLSSETGLAAYRLGSNDFLGRGGNIDTIGGPNLGGACALSPCVPQWGNGYGANYWGVHYAPRRDPTYGGHSTDVIAFDRANFNAESKRDCDQAKIVAAEVGFKVGATLVSCGLAETGIGLWGCAAGLGSLGKDVAGKINSDTCGQPYPGPGKWKP